MLAFLVAAVIAQPTFAVSFDAAARAEPASGRLVVYLIREGARVEGTAPSDGPFWTDPQPMFGVDVAALQPGAEAVIDDTATSFPEVLSGLAHGNYRAQAVLDVHRDNSNWRHEAGNLYSDPVAIRVAAAQRGQRLALKLTNVVAQRGDLRDPTVEIIEIPSTLLSDFHGRRVTLRAGVVLPRAYDPNRRYPAVYEVPGFGGDHAGGWEYAAQVRRAQPGTPEAKLAEEAFWIVLDPESGNGHTLFADSAVNGPRGQALVAELLPALEARYPLIAECPARLLRGHSSGGWSTLWLAITYPETFGACWSTSPDPVDFRRFQYGDIYSADSMYVGAPELAGGAPEPPVLRWIEANGVPSYRVRGFPVMSVRQENLMEEVLGPRNTSGQQWDSWQAVFGPRDGLGNPGALFDPATGLIDRGVAERYRRYDIGEIIRSDAPRYSALFQQRVRLLVGDLDNFYLNEAVALLKREVDAVSFLTLPEGGHGYVKVMPGMDHGSVLGTDEARAIPGEMLDHIQRTSPAKR